MRLRNTALPTALVTLALCTLPSTAATHHRHLKPNDSSAPPVALANITSQTAIGNLIQAKDGNFYGVTNNLSKSAPAGTLYMVTQAGQYSTVYTFGANGQAPAGAVFQGKDGNLYGLLTDNTTNTDLVAPLQGSLFVYNIARRELVGAGIYALPSNGGESLTQDADGNLYGVDSYDAAYGDIFKVTINASPDGSYPPPPPTITVADVLAESDFIRPVGTPVVASDGMLYGTTKAGQTYDAGGVFQYDLSSPTATPKLVGSSFGDLGVSNPAGGLVEASDGNLYGIVSNGGTAALYQANFAASPTTLQVIHTYTADENQQVPYGTPLAAANDIVTAGTGGNNSAGTVTQVEVNGSSATSSTSYNFPGGTGGSSPTGSPAYGEINGNVAAFGATAAGGSSGDGVVYAFEASAPPILSLVTTNTTFTAGAPITLNWNLENGYSTSANTCYAYSSDYTFSGQVPSSGTMNVTPAHIGAHQYAITCGGVQSAVLNLAVTNGTVKLLHRGTVLTSLDISFGAVPENSIAQAYLLTISNTSPNPFPVAFAISGSKASLFQYFVNCPQPLPAGQSCLIQISYNSPSDSETDSVIYTIGKQGFLFDPGNTGTLTAHSVTPGVVTLSATSHNFGNVVEATTPSYTFQVYNGTQATQSFSVSGTNVKGSPNNNGTLTTTCGSTLAMNQACSVTYSFTPTVAGALEYDITVTTPASVKPAGVVKLVANVTQ